MLIVELKRLGKNAGAAGRFLGSVVGGSYKDHGNQLQLEGAKARTVKQQLHKFLHDNKLENYRVIIVNPDLVEVIPPRKEKVHSPHVRRSKSARRVKGLTIPQYWVSAATGGPITDSR